MFEQGCRSMTVRTVVFDMDGTLVQTRAASWEVFQDTALTFDLPVRSAQDFFALFQENFFESLARICPDQATAAAVRTHFMTGLKERYQPDFVPGMVDVIKALAPHYALAVMSSNSMDAIRRILEKAGVAQCFAHVFSAEVGTSKRSHLEQVQNDPAYGGVRQCSPSYLEADPSASVAPAADPEVVLITDTVGDVQEAMACGTRAVGVAWGMHGADALRRAGAERVVYWPQEIVAMLLPDGTAPGAGCACGVPGGCAVRDAARPAPDPVATRTDAAVPGTSMSEAARLGSLRRARRRAVVPARSGLSPDCRCGKACGVTDAVHRCGPQVSTSASAAASRLGTAIARIAHAPP